MKHILALFFWHRGMQGKQFSSSDLSASLLLLPLKPRGGIVLSHQLYNILICAIKLVVTHSNETPDLIPAWSSCSLHLLDPSGSSCGLVKTHNLSLSCRAQQSHLHPLEGPYWGRRGIYPPSANPSPNLLLHHFLRRSSSPLGRARGTGQLTSNWSVSAFFGSGNSGCENRAKKRRCFWWSHDGLESVSLCFSLCICWLRERPPIQPRWRRAPRSRRTSHSCTGSSFPRPSCRWDLPRCWRCRQWCRWCCLGLSGREMREGERDEENQEGRWKESIRI